MSFYKNTIIILASLLSLVAASFFITAPHTASAATCAITSAKFVNYSGTQPAGWYKADFGRLVHIQIITTDCASQVIEVSLTDYDATSGDDDLESSNMDNRDFTVPASNKLDLYLWAGEDECDAASSPDCNIYISVWDSNGSVGLADYTSLNEPGGVLRYDCDGTCDVTGQNWKLVPSDNSNGGLCNITNATFTPAGTQTDPLFYSDDQRPEVIVNIQTENCAGKVIKVNISEIDGALDDDVTNFAPKTITVPSGGNVLIKTKAGDDECEHGAEGPDCHYFLDIGNPVDIWFSFKGKPGGELKYECDDDCTNLNYTNWTITYHNGVDAQGNPVYSGPTVQPPIIDPSDPCANTDDNGVTTLQDDCYTLLAPIGDMNKIQGATLGTYLNRIIKVVISLAAVLAVIMIIVGGVQYMTTDAFAGKSDARETITKALLGLVLALGSYLILKTINPNLLQLEPNIQEVIYTTDSAGWLATEATEPAGSTSGTYSLAGTFTAPTPSTPQVTTFVNNLTANNLVLEKIVVQTAGVGSNNNATAKFIATDGSSVTINVKLGISGVSANNAQVSGDNKTPLGTYTLNSDQRPTGGPQANTAAMTQATNPPVNLGAAYYQLSIAINNQNRGIGFHGHKNNTLGGTNGCIRMKNDDLLLLGPHMRPQTVVEII